MDCIKFDSEVTTTRTISCHTRGAGARKRIEHKVAARTERLDERF
jgi:hypothetical protein